MAHWFFPNGPQMAEVTPNITLSKSTGKMLALMNKLQLNKLSISSAKFSLKEKLLNQINDYREPYFSYLVIGFWRDLSTHNYLKGARGMETSLR